MKYKSSNTYYSKVISNVKVFKKWVILQGQGHRVKNNVTHGKITRNTHVKYQSSSIHCLKVISKVKVSERMTKWRNDRMTDRTKIICPPPPIFDLGGIKTINSEKMEFRSHTICYFFFLDLLLVCADHETWLHLHKLPPVCRGAYDLSERGFLQF